MNEAPPAWANYGKVFDQITVDLAITEKTFGTPANQATLNARPVDYHVVTSGAAHLFEVHKPSGLDSVVSTNAMYSFVLDRQSRDAPYSLKSLTGSTPELGEEWDEVGEFSFAAPVRLGGIRFGELIRRRGFLIKSVSPERDGDTTLARVDFDCEPDQKFPVVRGWLRFDPENSWLLHDAELQVRDDSLSGVTLVYGSPVGGLPTVKEVNRHYTGMANRDKGTRQTARITRWDRSPIPDSRFTLTAYGLPEVNLTPVALGRSHAYLWWIAAGLLCGVAAFGVRLAGRRLGAS